MFTTFYNETIRKTVVAFGSLFNEIFVQRRDKNDNTVKRVLVPITYAAQEKFIRMLNEFPDTKGQTDAAAIASVLPRMGFSITSINYDGARKRNTVYKRFKYKTTDGLIDSQFSEVPYNISFQLAIATRTMDDALQIVEQILPFFAPEFVVTLNMNTVHPKVDVPVVLSNVTIQEDYEGDFFNRRFVSSTLEFLAKSYVYGPISRKTVETGGIITAITGDFYNQLTADSTNKSNVTSSFGITGDAITGTKNPVYYPAQGRTT